MTTRSRRRSTWFGAALLAVLLTTGLVPADAATGAEAGLGGGLSFAPGSVFPFPVGDTGTYEAELMLQNTFPVPLDVRLSVNAPEGVIVKLAASATVTLPSGPLQKVPFTIGIAPSLTTGTYRVIVAAVALNVPRDSGGGVTLAPAFAADFAVEVRGDTGTVTIEARSKDDGSALNGVLTLLYKGTTGPVRLEQVTGASLTRGVVPGDYIATFVIDGFVHQQQEFSIAAGETRTVTFSVKGVQIVQAVASAVVDDTGCATSADLLALARNSLHAAKGPVAFTVDVMHDGTPVKTITMATLPVLPQGDTTQEGSYRPDAGFTDGTWTFHFAASSATFSVVSAPDPSFVVKSCGSGAGAGILAWLAENEVLAITGTMAITGGTLGTWWFFIVWRRRRRLVFTASRAEIHAGQVVVLEGRWHGLATERASRLAVRWEEIESGRRSALHTVEQGLPKVAAANTWWRTGGRSGAVAMDALVPGPSGAPEPGVECRLTVVANPGRDELVLGSVVVTAQAEAGAPTSEGLGAS